MAQVNVSINGQIYRIGCDDGQEEAILALAGDIDRRIIAFKENFGEVGDKRLVIMAALELGDELAESHRRLDELEGELRALKEAQATAGQAVQAGQARLAATLEAAAARIERLTQQLNGEGGEE